MAGEDHDETLQAFKKAVNMPPGRLEKWLQTKKSKSVGYVDGASKHESDGKEAVGHASGRRIIAIKRTKKADLSDADFAHMRKVIGYVSRHSKQKPSGDVTDTRWRFPS